MRCRKVSASQRQCGHSSTPIQWPAAQPLPTLRRSTLVALHATGPSRPPARAALARTCRPHAAHRSAPRSARSRTRPRAPAARRHTMKSERLGSTTHKPCALFRKDPGRDPASPTCFTTHLNLGATSTPLCSGSSTPCNILGESWRKCCRTQLKFGRSQPQTGRHQPKFRNQPPSEGRRLVCARTIAQAWSKRLGFGRPHPKRNRTHNPNSADPNHTLVDPRPQP